MSSIFPVCSVHLKFNYSKCQNPCYNLLALIVNSLHIVLLMPSFIVGLEFTFCFYYIEISYRFQIHRGSIFPRNPLNTSFQWLLLSSLLQSDLLIVLLKKCFSLSVTCTFGGILRGESTQPYIWCNLLSCTMAPAYVECDHTKYPTKMSIVNCLITTSTLLQQVIFVHAFSFCKRDPVHLTCMSF